MVALNTFRKCAHFRVLEKKPLFQKDFKYVTAVDLNKCLRQI